MGIMLHNRPFSMTVHTEHGDEVEIFLEEYCTAWSRDDHPNDCIICSGTKFCPTNEGEIILPFISANFRLILPNIETLAKFLDVFDVNYRHR